MEKSPSLEQTFIEAIEQYKHLIYKVCYMYSSDGCELNDLYQEVVVNLWRGFKDFKGDSALSTWIYRVALNTCISYYRKTSSRPQTVALVDNLEVYEDTVKTEQIRELYRLVNMLNKFERALILLWLDNKTYEEIADIMGLSRNTIASKLKRVKTKLVDMSNQ
jgi:RNA polymerase sigma-70 factor (ECF subfamily)